MTPLLGPSKVRRRFREKHPGTFEVLMGIRDCLVSVGGHIPDERLAELMEQYPENERETRLNGADMQGEGAVFETPIAHITHTLDPATFPPTWKWMWGLDFRHTGSETSGHPFAAVLVCRDPDNDVIYVVAAIRMFGLAPMHVAAIKANPMWDAPVAWPHDGGRGASILAGDTIAATYKKLGLFMQQTHATFPDGGYNTEAGVTEIATRSATNRLKIAAHLTQLLDEYQGYHRVNGLLNKVDDDLLSALRVACMAIRGARSTEQLGRFRRGGGGGGNGPLPAPAEIDPWTGT